MNKETTTAHGNPNKQPILLSEILRHTYIRVRGYQLYVYTTTMLSLPVSLTANKKKHEHRPKAVRSNATRQANERYTTTSRSLFL